MTKEEVALKILQAWMSNSECIKYLKEHIKKDGTEKAYMDLLNDCFITATMFLEKAKS